jgi:PAS domain S-box-containing protein
MNPVGVATMDEDINCINFKGLFAFLENQYGPSAVKKVSRGLVNNQAYRVRDRVNPGQSIPVQPFHLTDSSYWVSNEFSLQLLANVNDVVQGDNPLFIAGAGAVRESLSKSALFAGRLLGLSAFIRKVASINGRFNRTKHVSVTHYEKGMARLELRYINGFQVTRDVCNWNLGIYTELIRQAGMNCVKGSEIRCVRNGDPCCEFQFSWSQFGPLRRIARNVMTWLARNDIQGMVAEHEAILSERDELINRLMRSEDKYRTLFEGSMEAMTLTKDGRIRDVNPAWLTLHSYSEKSQVIGRNVISYIHPTDQWVLSMRRKQWPNLDGRNFTVRDLRSDGSAFEVEAYSSRIHLSGESMILSTIRDVSSIRKAEREREQLEIRLRRAEKLEAMGTLAGGVAHDLNNILSGIVSYPELLLLQLPEESAMRGPVQTIHDSGIKAAAIVQDLLTIARRGVSVNEVVNLNDIIADYLQSPEFNKMTMYHPQVEVCRKLSKNLGNVLGSPIHLCKVLMNLVLNAAEAMPDGGTIKVFAENRCLEESLNGYEKIPPDDYVTLTVEDTGTGIAVEDLNRIFEPFFTKKKMGRSGTGLGMSVVWGTVKDHNGFIDARSTEGLGTTFVLFFPKTSIQRRLTDAEFDMKGCKGRGQSILVVDDVREQREIASNILTELGYRVNTVSSGEAAVSFLETSPVDLVILDMIMDKGMDGLDTFKRIAEIRPDQKAIIASGYAETDRVKEAMKRGVKAFIHKPYSISFIAEAVHTVFGEDGPGVGRLAFQQTLVQM